MKIKNRDLAKIKPQKTSSSKKNFASSKQQGFSIIGVLVAMGVAGVVSLALIKTLNLSLQGQKSIEQRMNTMYFRNEITDSLADPAACLQTFQNFIPSQNGTVTQILDQNGIVQYQTSSAIQNSTLTIKQMRIQNWQAKSTYSGNFDFQVILSVQGESLGAQELLRTVKVTAELNDSGPNVNKVKSCVAYGSSGQSVWTQKSNGDIYYSAGNVGLGTSNPTTKLYVTGDIYSTGNAQTQGTFTTGGTLTSQGDLQVNGSSSAGAYYYTSDASLKENVQPLDGLDIVRQLRGVYFQWKKNRDKDFGLIAQEVASVLPEAVWRNPSNGLHYVKYGNMVAPLIEAVKSLDHENQQLKNQLKMLNDRLEKLESQQKP